MAGTAGNEGSPVSGGPFPGGTGAVSESGSGTNPNATRDREGFTLPSSVAGGRGGRLSTNGNGTPLGQLAKSLPVAAALLIMTGSFLWFQNQESGRNRDALHEIRISLDSNAAVSRDTVKALERLNEEFSRRNAIADRAVAMIEANTKLIESNTKNVDRITVVIERLIDRIERKQP
jgi:hypothetical protein